MKEKQFSMPGPARRFDSIDEEISADIEHIRSRHFASLYTNEKYRNKRHSIDILCPSMDYAVKTPLLKNVDHVRFLLSLYPDKKDLARINRIILRPRHIEAGRIELMALYLRAKKTLVHYLYVPHTYDITKSASAAYNEFIPFDSARMINRMGGSGRESDMMIPPLLYIISMLGPSGNDIDKFFLKSDDPAHDAIFAELDEISEFYRQNGY